MAHTCKRNNNTVKHEKTFQIACIFKIEMD